jgi:Rrf2 family protein
MIKISKKSQYGLRAMLFLAKNYDPFGGAKQVCSTKKISKEEGIPFDFLEKIISKIERADLVKSKKGILGGYFLAKSPKKINVREVISVLEDNIKSVDCGLCSKLETCSAKNVWQKLDASFNKTLNSITLAELIK